MLHCSPHEWDVLVSHYLGSPRATLTRFYRDYFIHDVMGGDEVKLQQWIRQQRESFKYAHEFEKIWGDNLAFQEIAPKLKLIEKEYVRLLVEYLGNPPFLVEDYESIDW